MSWWKLKGPSRWFRKEVRDKLSIDDVLDLVRAMAPADKLRIYDLIRTEITTMGTPQYAWGPERNKEGEAASGQQPHN